MPYSDEANQNNKYLGVLEKHLDKTKPREAKRIIMNVLSTLATIENKDFSNEVNWLKELYDLYDFFENGNKV